MAKTNKKLKPAKTEHVHTITAKIRKNILSINKTTFKAVNNAFNVNIKLNAETISIMQSVSVMEEPVCSRILRSRSAAVPILRTKEFNNKNKSRLVVAKNVSKSTNKVVDEAWERCKAINNSNQNKTFLTVSSFGLNAIVMAKLKGHKPWPAQVLDFAEKSRVFVQFFGAKESEKFGFVNVGEITPFMNSTNVVRTILSTMKKNILFFKKGVQEAEIVCGF